MYPKLYVMCNKETGTSNILKIYVNAEDGISMSNLLHFETVLKILVNIDTI